MTRADKPTPPISSRGAQSADETLVGQRVGKYEVIRVIGRGGMGMVYEALNKDIGKRVAMKFVDAEMAQNKDAVARFQREAQAASAVESAHIVEIFDSGASDEGLPFIVMELLRGEDLGHRIKRCGRLDLPEALHIIAQILRGLHRAHEAGIVHRDLKPDNIFLVDRDDDANFAKILDFGISKMARPGDVPVHTLTRQGTVLGTPFYMSPEQAQALADIDGRTDLWSVGAILYECLTGRPPYTGTTYEQVIINICMKDAEDVRAHNPAVPEPLARVLQKALARERTDRFQNAREFLDALIATSGGLLSSRPGSRGSGDDLVSGRLGSTSTPMPRKTPSVPASTPDQSFEPTLEVQPNNPSRVGWSTNGRVLAARRDRRRFVAVAVGALLVGGVGAYAVVKLKAGPTVADAAIATSIPEVEYRLTSNAKNPRYWVNGVEVPSGVIHGAKGDVKRVRVEADGFVPKELDVKLDGNEATSVQLAPSAQPVVEPVDSAAPTASSGEPDHKKNVKPGGRLPLPKPSVDPSATAKTVETPRPPSTGVAGELKLKPE